MRGHCVKDTRTVDGEEMGKNVRCNEAKNGGGSDEEKVPGGCGGVGIGDWFGFE